MDQTQPEHPQPQDSIPEVTADRQPEQRHEIHVLPAQPNADMPPAPQASSLHAAPQPLFLTDARANDGPVDVVSDAPAHTDGEAQGPQMEMPQPQLVPPGGSPQATAQRGQMRAQGPQGDQLARQNRNNNQRRVPGQQGAPLQGQQRQNRTYQGNGDGVARPIPSVPLPPLQRQPVVNPRPPRPRTDRPERVDMRDQREPRVDARVEREATPAPAVVLEPGGGYLVALNGGRFVLRNRTHLNNNTADLVINPAVVRNLALRSGDLIQGAARPPRMGERLGELVQVETVNDLPPDQTRARPRFDTLTPTFPERQITLERDGKLTGRVIDLISPIGFGSRVLIVSPPKAGKTTVLKEIALAVSEHYPDAVLILCLVGERPEEVTDLRMTVRAAEVISSTFDEAVEYHVELAELTIERAKRLVEMGKDVVLLLDSITRLTRAYNLSEAPQGDYRSSGRTLSGGIDASALYPPKRFFGAARACQEGGSLTVIASCLVDTGSRMEDVIYEELKGTGNSELVLDRHLAEERIFPAIDINRSSTRREDLLLPESVLPVVVRLRRALSPLNSTTASRFLLEQLGKDSSNAAFIARITGDREWARSVPRSNGEEDLGFGQRPGRY